MEAAVILPIYSSSYRLLPTGLEFVSDIKGGVIPKEFVASARKGFEAAMKNGVLARYPVESMRVRLFNGNIHKKDSHTLD